MSIYSRSTSPLPLPVNYQRDCFSAATKRWKYLRRMFKFEQMDFEFAMWQMVYLFIAPQKVYRNFHYRKHSKFQFARDDPAFLVLLALCVFVTSVVFAVVARLTFWQFINFLLYIVFIDCILAGLILATIFWYILNKYFRVNKDQDVEWGYAFDVHLNAFVPVIVISNICQVILYYEKLSNDFFIPKLIVNTLWLMAMSYYIYITFLGYGSLQILQKTNLLLVPLPLIFMIYVLSLIGDINIPQIILNFYKGRVYLSS